MNQIRFGDETSRIGVKKDHAKSQEVSANRRRVGQVPPFSNACWWDSADLSHPTVCRISKTDSRRVRIRSGLTLLEIVLALAIFSGALAALAQMAWNGTRATVQARLMTQGTIRCETKLNEVLAGVEPMQATSGVAFPDDNHWTWSQVVTPSSHKELVQIDLTVHHRGTSRLSNIEVTLRRWARQQSLFAKAASQLKDEEEKAKEKQQ